MNIILFGPPGVGKSTLIGILKSKSIRAIDLEDIYPHKVRFQMPAYLDKVVLGGADLNPAKKYRNAYKVLLYLDQDAYDERRQQRDAKIQGKGSQKHHVINDWLKGTDFDAILNVSGTPVRTANLIIKLMKKWGIT